MAQLAKIGAVVNQKQGLKKDLQGSNKKSEEDDKDDKEKSENGPKESQEEVVKGTSLSAFCQNTTFVFCNTLNFTLDCYIYTM